MNKSNTLSSRRTELDILRMLATIAVIVIHLCGSTVKSLDVNTSVWALVNCVHSSASWSVPVFVMISGCLFLNSEKKLTLRDIYGKYIKHIAVCFVVWSAVFQLYYYFFTNSELNLDGFLCELIIGPYPFWYLYMIIGLYMIVPFLRTFSVNKRLLQYFITLFILFSVITNYATNLPVIGDVVNTVLGKASFYFVLGFTGYYILGHYIMQYNFSLKWEIAIYFLGIVGVLISCIGTTLQSRQQGEYNEWFSKYLMPNVIFESMAVFTLFVKRISKIRFSEKTVKLFATLTQLGFGVYLIHALVIEGFNLHGIDILMYSTVVMIPALTVMVYVISLVLTYLIRKVPFIGKRIT